MLNAKVGFERPTSRPKDWCKKYVAEIFYEECSNTFCVASASVDLVFQGLDGKWEDELVLSAEVKLHLES